MYKCVLASAHLLQTENQKDNFYPEIKINHIFYSRFDDLPHKKTLKNRELFKPHATNHLACSNVKLYFTWVTDYLAFFGNAFFHLDLYPNSMHFFFYYLGNLHPLMLTLWKKLLKKEKNNKKTPKNKRKKQTKNPPQKQTPNWKIPYKDCEVANLRQLSHLQLLTRGSCVLSWIPDTSVTPLIHKPGRHPYVLKCTWNADSKFVIFYPSLFPELFSWSDPSCHLDGKMPLVELKKLS